MRGWPSCVILGGAFGIMLAALADIGITDWRYYAFLLVFALNRATA